MTRFIDINADMGEGYGAYDIGNDAGMIRIINTANLACGFHGGDPGIMVRRCAEAKAQGVAVGAHPGYPDLVGFGRRHLDMSDEEMRDIVAYQIGALQGCAALAGHTVTHVKTHGALGHHTFASESAGAALIDAVKAVNPELIVMAWAGTLLEEMIEAAGLRVAREIYADRAYEDDGRLMSRKKAGSMITDPAQAAAAVSAMVAESAIICASGKRIPVKGIDTICTHGDSANATGIALSIKDRLIADGCTVQPFSKTMNG